MPQQAQTLFLIDQIQQSCARPGSRIALVGLSGVGCVRNHRLCRWLLTLHKGSHSLPSNMPTGLESGRPRRGFSGSTRATQPGLSRAIGKLQILSRSLGVGIPRQIYLSSCTTGCVIVRIGTGFLSSTTSTMRVSLSTPNLAIQTGFRDRCESISPKARMGRSS